MAEQPQAELSPVGASFAAHLSAFHRSLPPEEQKLLEEILALADRGMGGDDTSGYDAYQKLGNIFGESVSLKEPGKIEIPNLSFKSLLR